MGPEMPPAFGSSPKGLRCAGGTVRGARLALYPDAGHAFLFQDAAAFLPAVDEFLGPRR